MVKILVFSLGALLIAFLLNLPIPPPPNDASEFNMTRTFSDEVVLMYRLVFSQHPCLVKTCLSLTVLSMCILVMMLFPKRKIPVEGKVVFITGCDTGFGHELAKRLDSLGMKVFAGCLHWEGEGAKQLIAECSDRLHIVQVDVTSCESVKIARKVVEENLLKLEDGIWAIVNNAGIWTWGEVEWGKIETYKRLAEVNVYGMVRVTQAFLPLIRRAKGRVVNVTSMAGLWTPPGNAMYCMTKYATESLSEALRHEMYPWGVKVSMIEPGMFARATNIGHSNATVFKQLCEELWDGMSEECKRDYGKDYFSRHVQYLVDQLQTTIPDATMVIDAMVDALSDKNPKPRYLIGGFYDTMFMTFAHWLLPSCVMDRRYRQYYATFPVAAALREKK